MFYAIRTQCAFSLHSGSIKKKNSRNFKSTALDSRKVNSEIVQNVDIHNRKQLWGYVDAVSAQSASMLNGNAIVNLTLQKLTLLFSSVFFSL